ncbi:hypothetical protein [Martelella radicis]|uniref:Uncharacterized protein n=1 Tax=Martelella radicis TaxID=1397476 RepID=A0A7W6KHS7_9HYPH|nr:hypothetical protein [Martelella radicis]MBB4121548.1 hypothetical protein [Martelella radicis]
MQDRVTQRFQIGLMGAVLAALPIELAVSGAILLAFVFVDYLFDPKRMLRDPAADCRPAGE